MLFGNSFNDRRIAIIYIYFVYISIYCDMSRSTSSPIPTPHTFDRSRYSSNQSIDLCVCRSVSPKLGQRILYIVGGRISKNGSCGATVADNGSDESRVIVSKVMKGRDKNCDAGSDQLYIRS